MSPVSFRAHSYTNWKCVFFIFTELCAALVGVGIVVKAGSHYHLDKGNVYHYNGDVLVTIGLFRFLQHDQIPQQNTGTTCWTTEQIVQLLH